MGRGQNSLTESLESLRKSDHSWEIVETLKSPDVIGLDRLLLEAILGQ